MGAVKLSISVADTEARAIQRQAKRRKTTVSALIQRLIRESLANEKRLAAMDRVIRRMGGPFDLTQEEIDEIDREWGRR